MSNEPQENVALDAQIESEAEQRASVDPGDQSGQSQIPKKFVGKDIDDVFESYRALESEKGRLTSELGQARKDREDMERRLAELEARSSQPMHQPQPQYAPQQAPVQDPFADIEQQFEEDPTRAFTKAIDALRKEQQDNLSKVSTQTLAEQATNYYYQQKSENQDFARREAQMQRLLNEYRAVLPENAMHPAVIKLLDLASQGMDRNYYEQQAVEQAKNTKNQILDEKRAAQSEAPHSEGDSVVNFEDLSLEEMEKLLPKTDNF